jgi:hypothetical protein
MAVAIAKRDEDRVEVGAGWRHQQRARGCERLMERPGRMSQAVAMRPCALGWPRSFDTLYRLSEEVFRRTEHRMVGRGVARPGGREDQQSGELCSDLPQVFEQGLCLDDVGDCVIVYKARGHYKGREHSAEGKG